MTRVRHWIVTAVARVLRVPIAIVKVDIDFSDIRWEAEYAEDLVFEDWEESLRECFHVRLPR